MSKSAPQDKRTAPQDVENLRASITRSEDTIEAQASEIDTLERQNRTAADEIFKLEETIEALKAENEKLRKDNALTYEKYNVVVEAINSSITRKELRALVN